MKSKDDLECSSFKHPYLFPVKTIDVLKDGFNRQIDYLRIGVTDRCNLRCRYCMPEEGIDFSRRSDLLSYEEILTLAQVFKELGVRKVRITGGEPFIRKDVELLIRGLSHMYDDIRVTTNATQLHSFLPQMTEMGVTGLNISLDTLHRDKYFMITKRDVFEQVMQNIHAAKAKDIKIKINVVLMKGINDDEIEDFLSFGKSIGAEIRFIEAMPFNDFDGNKDLFISYLDVLERLDKLGWSFSPVSKEKASSSLSYISSEGHQMGLIPAYSRSLCGSCNRIRLTPKGVMMNCLYSAQGLSLLDELRNGKSKEEIKRTILSYVKNKKKDGFEEEALRSNTVFQSMTTIGG